MNYIKIIKEDYEVERAMKVVKSGCSTIYKAKSKHFVDDYYAIKEASGEQEFNMLNREAEFLKRLERSNGLIIPRIKYATDFNHQGLRCAVLVTPYARYGDLTNVIKCRIERPEDLEFRCALANSMAKSIKFIHGNRIVHLDIKPVNFFLDTHNLWLGDFGLAGDLSQMGFCFRSQKTGTGGYRPPNAIGEPIWNDSYNFTPYTDLWALAVTVHELFYAQKPYHSRNDLNELEKAIELENKGVEKPEDCNYQRFPEVDEVLNLIFMKTGSYNQIMSSRLFNENELDYARFRHCYPPVL